MNSPKLLGSGILKPATYKMMEPVTVTTTGKRKRSPNLTANLLKPVVNGIAESVTGELQNADTSTFARGKHPRKECPMKD